MNTHTTEQESSQIRSMLATYTGYDGMTSSEADDLAERLAIRVNEAKAEAWDEGYEACCEIDPESNVYAANPYRTGDES